MRVKKYLGINTLEAARERCSKILSSYDEVVVSFSGGKDSLVLLELMDQVRVSMGIQKKLTVIFYDEDCHIDFVEEYYRSDRFNFIWACVPLKSQKYILGKSFNYVQWDISRSWLRQPPEFAVKKFAESPVDQKEVFAKYFRKNYAGNVCVCLGIRAEESMNRRKGVLRNPNMDAPYITEEDGGFDGAKPIYDWSEKDIFKFLYENNIRFTEVYNQQTWSGNLYRVATPLVSEAAKRLSFVKVQDPVFYDRLTTLFPEMLVQESYYKDMDMDNVFVRYGISDEGMRRYIEENLTGVNRVKASKQLEKILKFLATEEIKPERGISLYPIYHVFQSLVNGSYKKFISIVHDPSIGNKHREYEKKYYETSNR